MTLTPTQYKKVTFAVLWALGFIIVTGGAVRLTGSGLGCSDWPNCGRNHFVAQWQYHAMVEFINRIVTALVSVGVIVAVLGSILRRPRRADLISLSCGLVGGVIGQIVLGGITVLYKLAPPFVMAHFLLSVTILSNAVVLHHRAGHEATIARSSERSGVRFSRVLVFNAGIIVFTGTIVTATGPHAGSNGVRRLNLIWSDVARVHGTSVMIFLVLTLLFIRQINRKSINMDLMSSAEILLAVVVLQAGIGYTQYFTGVPALLVGFHIAGATAVWVGTLHLHLESLGYAPMAPDLDLTAAERVADATSVALVTS